MKITLLTICGESDHPLLDNFLNNASKCFDHVVVQFGVVRKWKEVNGNTSGVDLVFEEKHHQQNFGLDRVPADTDYLATFDIDEFIELNDMLVLRYELERFEPDVVTFTLMNFWKGFQYIAVGGDGWGYNAAIPRIFRYKKGMFFNNHRPPQLENTGKKQYQLVIHHSTIKILHFSYVFDVQVERKMNYYKKVYPYMAGHYDDWLENCYRKWTPENRIQIEEKYSLHPSCSGAYSFRLYRDFENIISYGKT